MRAKGLVIFCQMDVTGRSESDPAAAALSRNILQYASTWKPSPIRKAVYAGDAAGKSHLEKAGVSVAVYNGAALSADQVLVVGAGGGKQLADHAPAIAAWLKAGGNLLALGLDEAEANALLPAKVRMKKAEHIATCFDPPALRFRSRRSRPFRRPQPHSARSAAGVGRRHGSWRWRPGQSGKRRLLPDGALGIQIHESAIPQADLPAHLVPGDAAVGQYGRARFHARAGPLQQSRGRRESGEALAGRPVPRSARGMGPTRTGSSAGRGRPCEKCYWL